MVRPGLALMALFAVSACTQVPAAPSQGPFQFSGTVSMLEGERVGAPINGALLTVINGVNQDARVTTDHTGHYEFRGLDPGRFTVSIDAPGFQSATPVVNLYVDTKANFALSRR